MAEPDAGRRPPDHGSPRPDARDGGASKSTRAKLRVMSSAY